MKTTVCFYLIAGRDIYELTNDITVLPPRRLTCLAITIVTQRFALNFHSETHTQCTHYNINKSCTNTPLIKRLYYVVLCSIINYTNFMRRRIIEWMNAYYIIGYVVLMVNHNGNCVMSIIIYCYYKFNKFYA